MGDISINLTGKHFGRWIALGEKNRKGFVFCKCECGTERDVRYWDLVKKKSRSCGCLRRDVTIKRNTTHGMSHHSRLWRIWVNMRTRCYNSNASYWDRYGGRGITVCKEWRDSFQSFYDWAINNGYSDKLTIDRINNDGDYEPSNCRWVTVREQSYNRSDNHLVTLEGTTLPLDKWSRKKGLNPKTVRDRLIRGWSYEKALNTPPDPRWTN